MKRQNPRKILFHVIFWVLIPVAFIACTGVATPPEGVEPFQPTEAPATEPVAVIDPAQLDQIDVVQVSKLYTAQLPSSYQTMVLPAEMLVKLQNNTATIASLPDSNTLLVYNETITAKSMDLYVAPEVLNQQFNLVNTAGMVNDETTYIAIPAAKMDVYPFDSGFRAGVIYNDKGVYSRIGKRDYFGDEMVEVWLFNEKAELRSVNGELVAQLNLGDGFYWEENAEQVDEPRVFFIRNGCWVCWGADGRCGCLICFQ